MCYIYKIINQINNKIYIGKTCQLPENRWGQHVNEANRNIEWSRPLYNAIAKYGIENFIFEVIEECDSDVIDEREIYYIAALNTYNSGYNATHGGDGKSCGNFNEDEIIQYYKQGYNITATSAFFEISRITTRKILRKNNISKHNNTITYSYQSKCVSMLDKENNEIKRFQSINDAVKYLGKQKNAGTQITKCCKGRRLTAFGYKWQYCAYSQ